MFVKQLIKKERPHEINYIEKHKICVGGMFFPLQVISFDISNALDLRARGQAVRSLLFIKMSSSTILSKNHHYFNKSCHKFL